MEVLSQEILRKLRLVSIIILVLLVYEWFAGVCRHCDAAHLLPKTDSC